MVSLSFSHCPRGHQYREGIEEQELPLYSIQNHRFHDEKKTSSSGRRVSPSPQVETAPTDHHKRQQPHSHDATQVGTAPCRPLRPLHRSCWIRRRLRVWSATKDLCDKLNCYLVIIFGTNLLFPVIWCQSLKITYSCYAELRFRIKISGSDCDCFEMFYYIIRTFHCNFSEKFEC
ncbi:hypothetical protein TNIN_452661 [Trichonephila inaurata madagascariensis]|uniref:Uncharacterized protein n=1 Tax=Trichonephila inaurata madagascariensis TaxID=2747483 RepID=A0A8X6XFN5_9ARAC|nr:hypothetical protein TNIN_452661 [Trichonephila inaurata madagascariensis]